MVVRYTLPENWISYDPLAIMEEFVEAKASVLSLTNVPYQRSWAEKLQKVQLKSEVAGTSRIEGAEFTERELDLALGHQPDDDMTRSQRQARSAISAYRWLAELSPDYPVSGKTIIEVHRRMVTGCDEDHCEPGALRKHEHNVTFGTPRHRGVDGGKVCKKAFSLLCQNMEKQFRDHDQLIQALALHYHIGAMHPFGDGNGRTARAVEAFMLQKIGLRDTLFIALSNYYYDEKKEYLAVLSETRASKHDLTPFLKFGLRGIKLQCRRLTTEINVQIQKALFRDMANDLFTRLHSPRKRVIAKRQLALLNLLLERGAMDVHDLDRISRNIHISLRDPWRAFVRDISHLLSLGAVHWLNPKNGDMTIDVDLQWPQNISEGEFLERLQSLPKAKTYKFLQRPARG